MISIRGGSGLGDAIYVQGVARHLIAQGHKLEVCTAWPDVFRPLNGHVRLSPFRRKPIDRLAHYANRRAISATNQFEDCCINAGVGKGIDFKLDWLSQNESLIGQMKGAGKPIIVVQMPRPPFGRSDGFGMEFLPDCGVIQRAIDMIGDRAFKVQIGQGDPLYRYRGIDLDLSNKTSVSDVLDIGATAQGFVGQCSFIIPLAEVFGKPVTVVWSRAGLRSQHEVIRQMTPQKILHGPLSRFVVDDCKQSELGDAVDALCDAVGSPALV